MSLDATAADPSRKPMSPAARRTGRWPDFFIIGAMKSGTTSLCDLLERDRRIFMCAKKEPQFFSRDQVHARGDDWYRGLFADAEEGQVCGEASTCYSRHPHYADAAGRIARAVPAARLIYIMRHPVERAYSHYQHRMEERAVRGEPILSFEEAVAAIPEIVDASLYVMQMERYLAHFPRERLLPIVLEDLARTPDQVSARVQEFLGLAPMPLELDSGPRANEAGSRLARAKMRRTIKSLRESKLGSALLQFVPPAIRRKVRDRLVWSRFGLKLASGQIQEQATRISPLTPAARKGLLDRFAGPTRQLERFMDRPLPRWFE